MIPYGRQDISENDIQAVVEVLQSDFLTQGPIVGRFENAMANYCGARRAVATNSATSALHIACLALGLGSGDWLWTSPLTFVASANCGLYCGARVDFVDIDPATYNMSAAELERKLFEAEKCGRLPKIVVVVHLGGEPCDMLAIHGLAKRYGFFVIEDASHAVGAKFLGRAVGDCSYSEITVFSFHPVKIITAAEGGLALTNDPAVADRMELLRSHGITRNETLMDRVSDGPWYYQQIALGYNYRMTELQAALGLSQLQRLDQFVARRHELGQRYDRLLAAVPLKTPWRSPENYSALHLYIVRLELEKCAVTQLEVFEAMRRQGVAVNLHYIPVHTQPIYARMGFPANYCPESLRYYSEAMSLPMYPTLSYAQQDEVVAALAKALEW